MSACREPPEDAAVPFNCPPTRLSLALLAALAALPAAAVETEVAGGKLSLAGHVTGGAAWRTARQDSDLLPNVNSSLVGIPGTAITPSAGRNQDDGNLNFNRGDATSQVLNAYATLGYRLGDHGAQLSAKAWFDYALEHAGRPWGNIPNGYTAGAALSDAGANMRTRFTGAVVDNANVFGSNVLSIGKLDWTLGYQKLDWGNRFIVLGGLRELNPLDVPALTRPGVLQREQETRIAVPQIFARLGVTETTSVEGFYQFRFEHNAPNQCGTFYSALDYLAPGCDAVMVGNLSDRTAVATGNFVGRAPTVMPSNGGQFGLALTHRVPDWNTQFGAYAAQFHSRSSFYGAIKSLRATGPLFVPGNPGGLNSTYFTEYPDDIRMFGLSFETRFKGGLAFGELTYRPNQPLQYNAADLLNGFLSRTAPTPLRTQIDALAPGASFSGYERHDNVQLQLGAGGQLPGVLGAAAMNWGGEVVYKGVPDLPDPSVVRFGRADVFGQGPVNGVCPPPQAPGQCSMDGYVSRHAFGYRLRGGLRYADVTEGMDLVPSLLFGHDVHGWSGDGGILEGRMLMVLALRANFKSGLVGEIAWAPTWGGDYNNQRDRSAAMAYLGYRF